MKILVDLTQIPINKVGVGVYAFNTFKAIINSNSDHEYVFLIQDDDSDFLSFKNSKVKFVKVKSSLFRNFALRILLEQFYIPYLCLKDRIDILHSLHYSFPLFLIGTKRVVTIHDLTFYLYPSYHKTVKLFYFKFFIYFSTILSDLIICVSKSTVNDLVKIFPNYRSKIQNIPLAVSRNIINGNVDTKATLEKFKILNKYILFIGTLEPRKNILSLLQAYSSLSNLNEEYSLVIAGKKGWFYESIFTMVNKLGIEDKVLFTGFVSDEEKSVLLSNCSLFVYPSFYEGFGLPVLEALENGIPTITSNISSMPEVAGDAAVLIDPNNVGQLCEEMRHILENQSFKDELSIRAKLRAKLYSWEKTAKLTVDAYETFR